MTRWSICLLLISSVWGKVDQPADMRVAAYERFKQDVAERIKEELDGEYSETLKYIAELNKPFKLGEHVRIIVKQGPKKEVWVSGVFQGIERANYAKIDGDSILKNDIDPLYWKRLYYGVHRNKLAFEVNQLRLELAEKRARREAVLREQYFAQNGYTERFFEQVIDVNGVYRFLNKLGNGTVSLELTDHPGRGYISGQLLNHSGVNLRLLLQLDKTVIAASDAFSGGGSWRAGSFKLSRKLASKGIVGLASRLKIFVYDPRIGSWQLKTRPANVKSRRVTSLPCPECDGTTRSLAPDGKTVIRCPAENGAAMVRLTQPVPVRTINYTFRLAAEKIRQPTSNAANLLKQGSKIAKAQALRVEQAIAQAKQVARLKREQQEAAQAASLEEQQRRAQEAAALAAARTAFDAQFTWLTPAGAKAEAVQKLSRSKCFLPVRLDDISYPTMLEDENRVILGFTDWIEEDTSAANDKIGFGTRYRILRIAPEGFEWADGTDRSRTTTRSRPDRSRLDRSRLGSSNPDPYWPDELERRSYRPSKSKDGALEVNLKEIGVTLDQVEYRIQYLMKLRVEPNREFELVATVNFAKVQRELRKKIVLPPAWNGRSISDVALLDVPKTQERSEVKIQALVIDAEGLTELAAEGPDLIFVNPEGTTAPKEDTSHKISGSETRRKMMEKIKEKKRLEKLKEQERAPEE